MANGNGTSKSWNMMQGAVGFGALLGFFANQAMWFYIAIYVPAAKELSPGILAILNQGSGSLTTFAGIVIGYYFGSSKGSTDKDETAKKAAETAATAVATAATATAATQATLDKVISGTGDGSALRPIAPLQPPQTVVMNQPDVTAIQPNVHNQPTNEQLIEAARVKFASGQDNEDLYRATLRALGVVDADIDAAVTANKPKNGG